MSARISEGVSASGDFPSKKGDSPAFNSLSSVHRCEVSPETERPPRPRRGVSPPGGHAAPTLRFTAIVRRTTAREASRLLGNQDVGEATCPATCPAGEYCEAGVCIPGCDEASDCPNTFECDLGSNSCVCPSQTHECSGVCVSDDDVNTCGTLCTPCQASGLYEPECPSGQCVEVCRSPNLECGGSCVACPTDPNATATGCDAGQCVVTACVSPLVPCPSGCCSGNVETIVEGSIKAYAPGAIAVDSTGTRHVAYFNRTDGTIEYAVETTNGWTIETIGDTRQASDFAFGGFSRAVAPSIAVDSTDRPHIVYIDSSTDLTHAVRNAAGWTKTTIDSSGTASAEIVIDDSDGLHVTYFARYRQVRVRYASFDGTSWTVTDVRDDTAPAGLTLGPNGDLHLLTVTSGRLEHAHYDGTSWTFEVVEPTTGGFFGPFDLDVSPNGTVHAAYQQYNVGLIHRSRAGGTWGAANLAVPDSDAENNSNLTIIAEDSGTVHIAYTEKFNTFTVDESARYVTGSGTTWSDEPIALGEYYGATLLETATGTEALIVGGPRLHVAVATRNASNWSLDPVDGDRPIRSAVGYTTDSAAWGHAVVINRSADTFEHYYEGAGGWTMQTVTASPVLENASAPVSDGSGNVYFAAKDASDELFLYTWDGTNLTRAFVSADVESLAADSVAIGPGDDVRIVYRWLDCVNASCVGRQLREGYRSSNAWTFRVVTSITTVGSVWDAAVDPSGYLHLATQESLRDEVSYSVFDGTDFTTQLLGDGGGSQALILDASGNPQVVTEGVAGLNTDIIAYLWDGTAFASSTVANSVDTELWYEVQPRIAFDGAGGLHVVYWDEGAGDLQLASYDQATWSARLLSTSSYVPQAVHLDFDASDPIVVFNDIGVGGVFRYSEGP